MFSAFSPKRHPLPPTEVSRQAMEACEAIISEIGAELHDDLIQRLSVLRLFLDKIERSGYDPAETQATLIKMQAEFQATVESVRRISRRLHPVYFESDTFENRISSLCQNLEMPGTVRIHPEFIGIPAESIPQNIETYLLRMVQELIHNAFRHSAAWHVWVRVKWTGQRLHIEVEDDGSGFTRVPEFLTGLEKKYNTLRMRADAIGAVLEYHKGQNGLIASIRLEIPL